MPGPPPKRAAQRRRKNTPKAGPPVSAPAGETPVVPDPDPEWHPIAERWFESLAKSGQSAFYTTSDWSTAFAVAESMSREFKPQPIIAGGKVELHEIPPRAAALSAWAKLMSGLLVTEGDRRRVGLELQRTEEVAPDVSELDEYRARLTS